MDGNKRWAEINHKKLSEGYTAGLNNLKKILEECIKYKICNLTVYALSSENIKRKNSIIIFNIIRKIYKDLFLEFKSKKVNLNIVGEKEGIPEDVTDIFNNYINKVKDPLINLNVAFNYGSQYEIKNIVENMLIKRSGDNFLKEIKNNMYLGDIPDPEILIRTGGFQRLSNFMLLNLSYTELFFTKTLWPDFSIDELHKIFEKFSKIKRNYGL
jgi:undecaprenyl diphosphate synthase